MQVDKTYTFNKYELAVLDAALKNYQARLKQAVNIPEPPGFYGHGWGIAHKATEIMKDVEELTKKVKDALDNNG